MRGKLDGGLSWLVVVSSFMQQFISMGTHTVFGLFYVDLLNEFNASKATTALVGSISFGVMFMIGPFTTALCHKYGNRAAALSGTIIHTLGLVLTSFVTNLTTMYLTYSLVMALGSSLIYYSSILILEEYFLKKLAFTNGIALSGAGVGTVALSPTVHYFLSIYKWRTTMRILSGFACLLVVCSVIHYLVVVPKRDHDNQGKGGKDRGKAKIFDKSLFANKAYVVYVVALSMALFGFYIPYVHLVRHCQDINISKQQASILVGYLAIAQTIGKIAFGRVADCPRVNRITLLQYTLLVISVVTTLLPIMTSIESIAVYCWLYGIHDGCFVVLIAVVTGDLVGREKLGMAFGTVYFFSCITMTTGPPIAGLIYDLKGTYEPAFFMAGAFTFLAVCLLFLVPILPNAKVIIEQVSISSSKGNKDESANSSPDDKAPMIKKDVDKHDDGSYQISTKSGSRRPLAKSPAKKVDEAEDRMAKKQENRFSRVVGRYLSTEHIVEQKDCLIGRVYSRENLSGFLPIKDTDDIRETDV